MYTCSCCKEKLDFNKYWSFCFDCREFVCYQCLDDYIEHENEPDPFYINQFCYLCGAHFFNCLEDDYKRILENIEDSNPKNEHVLHFYNAVFLQNGFGTNIDFEEAFLELFLYLTKNFPPALSLIANMYGNGIGIDKDYDLAYKYYLRAAMLGFGEALYCVGIDFLKGIVVKKDMNEGIFYIERAAFKGYKPAIIHLENLYKIKYEFKKAAYWKKKQKEQNNGREPVPGMSNLFERIKYIKQ